MQQLDERPSPTAISAQEALFLRGDAFPAASQKAGLNMGRNNLFLLIYFLELNVVEGCRAVEEAA